MKKLILISIAIIMAFASCKKTPEVTPEVGVLKAITLSKDTLKMNAGNTKSINFTTTPSTYDKTSLVWHSSDTTIISVNNSGVITAKKEGEAIVSVSNQGATVTKFCLISVLPELKSITLTKDTLKMNAGDTKSINFTTIPSAYDKTALVWHSSDTTIISVKNSGIITAKKEGQAIVSVSNQGATVTKFCLISVLPELKSITLTKDTLKMNAGDTKSINFTTIPSAYDKTALVWHSSDTTIISVKNSGIITAKKEGQAIVSVSNQGKTVTAFCLVSVSPKIDGLTVGLIAYYPFNDSGLDVSGNGNDGTLFNISSTSDRFGKVNAAYHFDGLTSYITVPDKPALRLNNTDFTISAWVKMDSYNSSYGSIILSKRLTGANNGWLWGVHGNVDINVGKVTYGPGGGSANAFSNQIIGLGNWHMITSVYTFANGQLDIYIDGVLDSTTTGILTASGAITSALYIGKDDPSVPANGYFFQGSLDDIRIYNRKLSIADIQKLYVFTN
jgi:uncharacterized protein YjdB